MRSPLAIKAELAEAEAAVASSEEALDEVEKGLARVSDPNLFGPGVRATFEAAKRFHAYNLVIARRRVRRLRDELEAVTRMTKGA